MVKVVSLAIQNDLDKIEKIKAKQVDVYALVNIQ
jgi:hypothetical protein